MQAACGTLSYVAPEVLRMEGYNKSCDLWSVGILMYLTLRAKLPFHDTTKNKIIARILRQSVSMSDASWDKVSPEAKDLITQFLVKDPALRIDVEKAMEHAWFESIRTEKKNATSNPRASQINLHTDITAEEKPKAIQMIRHESTKR
ncbi:Protein kinase domain containing protein, partial [Reticulomyxa filosa]